MIHAYTIRYTQRGILCAISMKCQNSENPMWYVQDVICCIVFVLPFYHVCIVSHLYLSSFITIIQSGGWTNQTTFFQFLRIWSRWNTTLKVFFFSVWRKVTLKSNKPYLDMSKILRICQVQLILAIAKVLKIYHSCKQSLSM